MWSVERNRGDHHDTLCLQSAPSIRQHHCMPIPQHAAIYERLDPARVLGCGQRVSDVVESVKPASSCKNPFDFPLYCAYDGERAAELMQVHVHNFQVEFSECLTR
jgi:hypothetical protein